MTMQLTVGQRIRRLREERGIREGKKLTRDWLAGQLGVSTSAVVKWEGDIQKPGPTHVLALAKLFEMPPDTFVSQETPNGNEGAETPPPYNEGREEEELTRIGSLPDPLLRTMERESIAAVMRAQGIRDACRAARIEAEKAPTRNLPNGISSDLLKDAARALRAWETLQRRKEGRGGGPPNEKPKSDDQTPPGE